MAGHSKFKNIMHRKGRADAVRSKLFSRLSREITVAAKSGMPDPAMNPRLRLAVLAARAENMPKDNIERAIRKGTGEDKEGVSFEQAMYEAYGPAGSGVLIQVFTDNRNRSVSEIRRVVTRANGNMAEAGAVSWQFTRKAYIAVAAEGQDPDRIFEMAVDAGADDVQPSDDVIEIYAAPESYGSIVHALEKAGIKPTESELRMEPNQKLELDAESTAAVLKLVENLEELDDVQSVFYNVEVSDDALALLA